ncbi:petC, partial [Symbiodinium sp. KB8]
VLLALGLLSTAFVAPRPAAPPRGDATALRAGGEYTGFVPDLQHPGISWLFMCLSDFVL